MSTILDTILNKSELPPVTLELSNDSIIRLSIALIVVILVSVMLHAAVQNRAK